MAEDKVAREQGYSHELPVKFGELVVRFSRRLPCTVLLQCEKDVGIGLCQYVDLSFMHHPYQFLFPVLSLCNAGTF